MCIVRSVRHSLSLLTTLLTSHYVVTVAPAQSCNLNLPACWLLSAGCSELIYFMGRRFTRLYLRSSHCNEADTNIYQESWLISPLECILQTGYVEAGEPMPAHLTDCFSSYVLTGPPVLARFFSIEKKALQVNHSAELVMVTEATKIVHYPTIKLPLLMLFELSRL